MNKKSFLLISLLIPTYTLFTAENATIPLNEPEEIDVTLEQRFLCEQKNEDGGVVCQMYECLNDECHAATAIKTDENVTIQEQKNITHKEMPSFDFDEYEILCPLVGQQTSSTSEEELPEEQTSETMLTPEESQTILAPEEETQR